MKKKIIIIGSTGKLGSKLLSFTDKNLIPIFCITCFKNTNKLATQKKKYNVDRSFVLSNFNDEIEFLKLLKKNIDIIYFLDFGSASLKYLNHFLKFNTRSVIAIANKEMIIAGGSLLQLKSKINNFFPLDSEHFLYTTLILKKAFKKIT